MKLEIITLGLLSLVAAYGCAMSDDNASEDETAESQDELLFRRGSVDHAAIVEVTTMMLASGPLDGLLDPYNQEDPFKIQSAPYARKFAQRLARFDAYDGRTDWTREASAAWVSRLASGNYLVVDTSKPCSFDDPHTYLEIERAKMTGREHTTCGGRMPNEDALDVTLNFLIRGPAASEQDEDAIRDGVEQATKQSVATFPYLAEMNGF